MYEPKHFFVKELVPPDIFNQRGEQSIQLIDERVLITLDKLGRDWMFSDEGRYTQSGLRTPDSDVYSPTSQHTFGRAMDCKFKEYSGEEIRQHVIENKALFPYITFIEDDVSWFHFDVRNCERITLWSPNTNKATLV